MKSICILIVTLFTLGTVLAIPTLEISENPEGKCRLANLIPKGTVELPEFDISHPPAHVPTQLLPDPLPINDVTIVLKEENVRGSYSLRNGVVTGLSTAKYSLNFQPFAGRIAVNFTVKHIRLTGDYEVADGKVNITDLGDHTISGNGPLNVSASEVYATLGATIRINPGGQIKLDKLSGNLIFDSVHIVAENLAVDGQKIDWEIVNALLKPTFDAIWEEASTDILKLIQNEINRLLEGCSINDLIDIVKPPQHDE